MRILILGGTVFLSKTVAAAAVAAGHEVICASRGVSGSPPPGARHLVWDRVDAPSAELVALAPDVVVDVTRLPSRARKAVAVWPHAHWVFISTISVYSDVSTPDGGPDTLPVHPPLETDVDLASTPETYGPMKVACERTITSKAASAIVLRPGLIVGPGDPTGRFSYWPGRLTNSTAGEQVLAPGNPDDAVQMIDVRDLADWIVDCAEQRRTGVLDAIGPTMSLRDLLDRVAAGVGATPNFVWVDQDFLETQDVRPWSGERSLPLWLPRPEYEGMLNHATAASFAAGLAARPMTDTAADTADWLAHNPDAVRTGLTIEQERQVLAAWREAGH